MTAHVFEESFNSLQTGKCIQRKKTGVNQSQSRKQSFNSLQTGKCIQSKYMGISDYSSNRVSIPFKRESVSKGEAPFGWL